MSAEGSLKASIIVRAYNEDRHIGLLFEGISQQEADFSFETILVDSGSTDGTVEAAREFGAGIVEISPENFSFGYSLNKGIERARGEFCVLISAHCWPMHKHWLSNILKPFEGPSVALVYGKQRGGGSTRYSEHRIFASWFPEAGGGRQQSAFCNNANAAIRRSLWDSEKYDESLTGLEDLDWARRAVAKGYELHYAPEAGVIHVHEETGAQIFRRYEREAIAMKAAHPHATFSFAEFLKLFTLNTLSDYASAAKEGVLIKNLLDIPAMRAAQFWGAYRGYNYHRPVSGDLKQKFYYPQRPGVFKDKANDD